METAPATALAFDPPRIERLPTQLINQIAAGEVVSRPAAALKELIENGLDAGATRIEIAVEEDALCFSVSDDGRGMDEADLRLSVERYATSKIRRIEDLETVRTRGFRGEALAALSAVSRLEIMTRRGGEGEGLRLRASGGRDAEVEPAAVNPGTIVRVRDLFYNTPARLKFLKRAVAEWGHLLQTIIRQALTRPDVAFAVRWKGQPYLDLPAGQPLAQRLAQVLPGGAGGDLLEVEGELRGVRVHGAITNPRQTRRDRRHQYFFINGRPIVMRPLCFAFEEAYRGLLMTQQHPMCALLIELPGELVDVNVHPTKEEVRLREEPLVAGALHRAVAEALRAADLVPTLRIPERPGPNLAKPGDKLRHAPPVHSSEEVPPSPAPSSPLTPHGPLPYPLLARPKQSQPLAPTPGIAPEQMGHSQLDFVPGFGLPRIAPSGAALGPAAPVVPTGADDTARTEASLLWRLRSGPSPPRALAQVAGTYIVADAADEGILLVDQHAAHEKILYLQYLTLAEEGEAAREVQPLLIPHTVELAPGEVAAMEALLTPLRHAGFDIEPFGGGTFVVQALPAVVGNLDVESFLRDLLDDLGQGDLPRELRRLRERICARASCRAAVKAGDPLTLEEMQRLLDDLLETDAALRCPHGRPTVLLLGRDQLDRQFGRLG